MMMMMMIMMIMKSLSWSLLGSFLPLTHQRHLPRIRRPQEQQQQQQQQQQHTRRRSPQQQHRLVPSQKQHRYQPKMPSQHPILLRLIWFCMVVLGPQTMMTTTMMMMMMMITTMNGCLLVVHAFCKIQNEMGDDVSLEYADKLPSQKVTYNPRHDRFECLADGACRNWNVAYCVALHCVGPQACEDAIVSDVGTVKCRGVAACQGAEFLAVGTAMCFGEWNVTNVCHGARLESTQQVLCLGPNACGSPDMTRDGPTDIKLWGPNAVVRCGLGKGDKACQNLIIYVHHGRRACFSQPGEQLTPSEREAQKHCAVLCDQPETDCDPETIHFQVYGK